MVALPLPQVVNEDADVLEVCAILHAKFCQQQRILCGAPKLTAFCSIVITEQEKKEDGILDN